MVVTGENLGFAGGMNVGIRRALALGTEHVVILNDDVVVEPGFVTPLVDALGTDRRLGAVAAEAAPPGRAGAGGQHGRGPRARRRGRGRRDG